MAPLDNLKSLPAQQKKQRLDVNVTGEHKLVVVKLVGHHSCGADRPLAVRFPAGPRKTVDPPKGNGLGQKKTLL